ncbi:MAG: hypothetical protein PVH61_30275 [Candidatus Aminicenantes bacterium]
MKKENLNLYAKISLFSIVLGMVIFSLGCYSKSRGKIIVDSPEVFTRERLVRQRLREKNWLEKKLDKDEYQFGYQGYRDVRIFSGMVAGLRGKYDPLGGKLTAERLELEKADTKRQSELAEIQHRLNKLKLEKQIANLEAGIDTNLDLAEPTGQGDSITGSDSDFYEIEAPYKSENLPSLPDPTQIGTTKAELTGIEKLRDEKAYRDAVNAMLRETILDDTHDLNGNTIYTLKFDITVLPGKEKESLGNVHLKLIGNEHLSDDEYKRLYQQWRDVFNRDLRREALSLQKRYQLGLLTEHEKEKLALDAEIFKIGAEDSTKTITNKLINKLSVKNIADVYKGLDESKTDQLKKDLNKAICLIVSNRYKAFENIVTFRPPKQLVKGDIYYNQGIDTNKLSSSDSNSQRRFSNFKLAIKGLEENNKPYIYTIEPKEYAQNISDVAAVEKLKNLVLSLNAIIPKSGINAEGYLNRMKRSQSLLHAIKRKPLVVGYIDGKSNFGWILGPRFEINSKGKIGYRHTHVQHSVQNSIVVPAWNKKVKLRGEYIWNNKKTGHKLFNGEVLEIKLPGDFSALTNGLLYIKGGRPQEPYIEPNQSTPQIILQAGRQEHILIRGKKLWRNPEVYIGSQKDNRVQVLPDMGGLIATFDKVITPARTRSGDIKVDLTIITSEGISRLNQAVTILPEAHKLETVAVKIISPRTYENGKLVLAANSSQFPKELKYYMFKLRIKVKDAKYWIDIGTPNKPKVDGNDVKLIFPKIQYDGNNAEMAADLQFKLRLTDDYISIPSPGGAGSFIFFKDPNDFKLFIKKKNRAITCEISGNRKKLNQDIVFNLVDHKLFFKGIPGSEALKNEFKLHFETKSNGGKSSSVMMLREDKDQVEFSGDKGTVTIHADKLVSKDKEKNKTIEWIFNQIMSTSQKEKAFKLKVKLPNGEQIEFRDDSKLKIKYKNK